MSQTSEIPIITFKNEELVDRKKITSILVKNNVEFYPIRNVRDEYKTTIRVRTPTPENRSPLPRIDKETKSKVDDLFALMSQSTKKKEIKYESGQTEELEFDPKTIPNSNKNYVSLTSNASSNHNTAPKKDSSKNLISDFTLPETASNMNSTQSLKASEKGSKQGSPSKEKDINKLIENVRLESKVVAVIVQESDQESDDDKKKVETNSNKENQHEEEHIENNQIEENQSEENRQDESPAEDRVTSENHQELKQEIPTNFDTVRDLKNSEGYASIGSKSDAKKSVKKEEVFIMSKDTSEEAKSNASSSVKTPTLGKSKEASQPGSDYSTKNKNTDVHNSELHKGEFSSVPSSNRSNAESAVSLGEKKSKSSKKSQSSQNKLGLRSDSDFIRQTEFLMAITKDEIEGGDHSMKFANENTARFQTEPVDPKSTFSSAAINKEEFSSKGQTKVPPLRQKQEFQSARSNRKENLPDSVKLKRDKEIIFIPDDGEGVIITDEIFRILMPHMDFSKFLSVLKKKGLKFYQIPGRKSNSPKKFMESLVIDPNSSFLSDFHPTEQASTKKDLYPKNWTPNSLGSFLFPNSGSQSPKGRSFSPVKRNESMNDYNRPKSARPLYRPQMKPSRDSSAELNREMADLINSKQLSEAIREIEEQPSNLAKSKDYSDINFSGMKPVFVVDSDNFHANYLKEQEEMRLYKLKLKEQKYDIKKSKEKIEKLIKNSTVTISSKVRKAEEDFKNKYFTALGHVDSNIERPESFRSSKQYDKSTPEKEKLVESERRQPQSARKSDPVQVEKLLKNFEALAEETRRKTEKLFDTFKKKELPIRTSSPPRKNTSIDNMNSQELIQYHAQIANKAKHTIYLKNSKYLPKEKFYEPIRRKADH